MDSTFPERLKLVRGGATREELSLALGIHANTLGRYERGEGVPDLDFIQRICTIFGIRPNWLAFGAGPMRTTDHIAEDLPQNELQNIGNTCLGKTRKDGSLEEIVCQDCTLCMVPMVEARLSAGGGSFETGGEELQRYAFRSEFLHRKGNPNSMVLMRVDGDSMEPVIMDGDTVLIDQSQKSIRAGRLYAVGVEDVVYCKVIDAHPGKIVLKSYNPNYDPLEIDARDQLEDGIRIIGKVVWLGREFR